MTYSTYNPTTDRTCLICGYPKYNEPCKICFLMEKKTIPEILDKVFMILWNYRMDEIGENKALSDILELLSGVK